MRYMLDAYAERVIRARCPEVATILDAQLSPAENTGCWVEAWVWLYNSEGEDAESSN
jgi:hypothetical protein